MRVLAPVVETPTLTMFDTRQNLTLRGAVALQLNRDEHPWHVLEPLEQRAEKPLRRFLVAAALHQDVEDVVVLVDSAPQVIALPVDRQKHLVQMPLITWLGASTLQLIRIVLPK